MPLKVTFELSDADLGYFKRVMAEAHEAAAGKEEADLRARVEALVQQVRSGDQPEFVRERVEKLEQLLVMIEDQEWQLAGADRSRVLKALAYFAEAEDMIPDKVPGIGFLDDAIMAELVVQELRHEIEAYRDFCHFRSHKERLLGAEARADRESWLAARRKELQARMRRRRRRRHGLPGGGRGESRSPFALF